MACLERTFSTIKLLERSDHGYLPTSSQYSLQTCDSWSALLGYIHSKFPQKKSKQMKWNDFNQALIKT